MSFYYAFRPTWDQWPLLQIFGGIWRLIAVCDPHFSPSLHLYPINDHVARIIRHSLKILEPWQQRLVYVGAHLPMRMPRCSLPCRPIRKLFKIPQTKASSRTSISKAPPDIVHKLAPCWQSSAIGRSHKGASP